MDKLIIVPITVAVIITAIVLMAIPVNVYTETYDRNLYYVNAPFGNYGIDGEGHFFLASGSTTLTTTEFYTVKFWSSDGPNVLKSLTLKANETPVIFDGTFKVEISIRRAFSIYGFELCGIEVVSYKLHLPQVPDQFNATGILQTP
jgi:hypothetical protein